MPPLAADEPMDIRHHRLLRDRADFHLCLARAWRTPSDRALAAAMREALADDLAELAAALGWDVEAPLADYRAQMRRLADDAALLQVYSALFLVPPVAAHINPGWYLDGAMDGGSVKSLERVYTSCGLQRDEGFRDLADHVSVQLEFAACLFAAEALRFERADGGAALPVDAAVFLRDHPLQWIDAFCADLERAGAVDELPANPYLPLARILRVAVVADAAPADAQDPKQARRRRAIDGARAKAAARGIGKHELEEIRRKLEARGLAADHLELADPVRVRALAPDRLRGEGPR